MTGWREFLSEHGHLPILWVKEGEGVRPRTWPAFVRCTERGSTAGAYTQCRKHRWHRGPHSAFYYHLGGLGCVDLWGDKP
jgi:hypothetical protein